jgi:ADP-ribose pyrophosphatase
MEELVSRQYLYRGRILNLRLDSVRIPNGSETIREVVEHPGAVVIVAVDQDGTVLLVRQYRHAVGRDILELPAGTLEKNEPPDAAAPRELKEETGYTAQRWDLLTRFFSSPGILTEELHIFLARDLAEGLFQPMEDEDISLERVPLPEALQRVRRGEIVDAKSMLGLLLAEGKLNTMARS